MGRKKKNNQALSFIALIVIAISIPASLLILQSGNLDFRFSAFLADEPQNVQVSDIDLDSFQVNWITEKPIIGGVQIMGSDMPPVFDSEATSYHSVVVEGLSGGQIYQYSILSGAETYLDGEVPYSTNTATIQKAKDNNLVYGQVFSADGITFQQGGLIMLEVDLAGNKSQILGRPLNEAGGYQFNLAGILDSSLNNNINIGSNADIVLTTYTLEGELPVTSKFTLNLANTRQLPNVYLGNVDVGTIPGVDGT